MSTLAAKRIEDTGLCESRLAVQYPTVERIAGDRLSDSLSTTEIGKNFRFPHAEVSFVETGNDGLHIGFARSSDYVIFVGGGEREDRMAVARADFDDAAVKAEIVDLPVIRFGKSLEGGNDDRAWNVPAVLLADNIIELAVGNLVNAPVSACVGNGPTDERDRTTPRFGMVGEVNAVSEHDPTRIAGRGFVAATCIFFRRPLRLASLNIAIEPASKQIGAVHGVPDKAVAGKRNFAVGHGREF